MVLNLQKQVQEKDDALMDISDKLSRKSEECESLVEERDMIRSKSSFDLQQVECSVRSTSVGIFSFVLSVCNTDKNVGINGTENEHGTKQHP